MNRLNGIKKKELWDTDHEQKKLSFRYMKANLLYP